VLDKDAPSSLRALEAIADPATREHLLRYATWRTKDPDEAQDLLADALLLALDPEKKPWTDTTYSFRRHMRRIMDDLAIERARKASSRLEITESELLGDSDDPDRLPDPGDERPGSDEVLHELRKSHWLRGLWSRLEASLAGKDPLAVRVYEAACLGHETPGEQAAHLGVPVEEIYEALRRLRYRASLVMADWKDEEARRMLEARTMAKKGEEPQ
jgi:DNA-directed RNA polymerase specialized sigma24 family protein